MLTELAEYAQSHELAARPGFKNKKVKAYVHLSVDGAFLGVEVRDKTAEPVYAPDIGAAAGGTRYCNILIEKAKLPLCIVDDEIKDVNVPTKHASYLSALDDGARYEPLFAVLSGALRNEQTRAVYGTDLPQTR